MKNLYLLVPFAPLVGAIVAGLFGRVIGRAGAHTITIAGVLLSTIASILILGDVLKGNVFNGPVYTWLVVGDLNLQVGFLIDPLTALMMVVVTFVSLMVHIYTIGYMADDPGYQRFFSYISLFTFSMLMLVMSNNFLQLFFGWEAVGLVSYLLIGFWYKRPSAIFANLKAFLVNRVGDFGFVLGIGLIYAFFGSLDYATVFNAARTAATTTVELIPGSPWLLVTVICICLFVGAMGKSAQVPLHVWLPDSMEGPTPISALIHAATMVTAGIFMVARMSPLFELSDIALAFVVIIGAITALFMGILGIVQNDIKRVVAYSTLSQLGYMTVALGVSAYSVAIFHLMTHAFFKALLFLAAGSVIIGMHHDQDIRNMGGLWKQMPVTWITFLIGTLALVAVPFFSGFYSKDSIIVAAHAAAEAGQLGAGIAYFAVLIGVFITAVYSFRVYYLVFHGKPHWDEHHHSPDVGHEPDHDEHHGPPHESPAVVTVPLVLLAIPSVVIGYVTIEPLLFGGFFGQSIFVDVLRHRGMAGLAEHFGGPASMALHAFVTAPFWLLVAGAVVVWLLYAKWPGWPDRIAKALGGVYTALVNNYYFDRFNELVFARGARLIGNGLWKIGDVRLIDGLAVNGSARLVASIARMSRWLQSGYIYHYAFGMIIGVLALISLFLTFNWAG